jgi:hypothetical protein
MTAGGGTTTRAGALYFRMFKRPPVQNGDTYMDAQHIVRVRGGEIVDFTTGFFGLTPTGAALDQTGRSMIDDRDGSTNTAERLLVVLFDFELIEFIDPELVSTFINAHGVEIAFIDMQDDPVFSVPNTHPSAVVMDASGNAYVGFFGDNYSVIGGAPVVAASGYVRKFNPLVNSANPSGGEVTQILAEYPVQYDVEASDYVEIAKDQTTLWYTSAGRKVLRYNVGTPAQMAVFATLPAESGPRPGLRGMRLLPPGDGSAGLLVADGINVKRLDASGNVIQTYTPARTDLAQDLDKIEITPGGTQFYVTDQLSTTMFHFDIDSGAELGQYRLWLPTGQLCGFGTKGGYRPGTFAATSSGLVDPDLDDDPTQPNLNTPTPADCCATPGAPNTGDQIPPDPFVVPPAWTASCAVGGTVPDAADVTNAEDWSL